MFSREKEYYKQVAKGQSPHSMIITCSDSRIMPNYVIQSNPGDVFVSRNAGNIVPSYGPNAGSEAAAIELAVIKLEVDDILILGHSDCGAVKLLLHPELLEDIPAMSDWLSHMSRTKEFVDKQMKKIEKTPESLEALLDDAIEHNVIEQMKNLKTHPSVAAALEKGKLNIHGWVIQIETAHVKIFDSENGKFRPIEI